jgi:2-amino-4-hydroxy-6-hydroxymethyldihydropteridine diphosphokinase
VSNNLKFSNHFPYKIKKNKIDIYSYTIGIGGNIGNVKLRFNKLFLNIKSNRRFNIIQTSPLLKNPPFGFLDQDDFLNAIMVINTKLTPLQFLKSMQRLELRYGRKRSFKDAPRTLDIDIIFAKKFNFPLFWDDEVLTIPHKHWKERDSVIKPLEYING